MPVGDLYLATSQIGKETTPGTPVAATRKVYYRDPSFALAQAPHVHEFATGTREQVRRVTKGAREVSGTGVMPVSADEILEWLLIGLKGGVTPVTATGVSTWTFSPGTTLDSATVEWNDASRVWQVAGVRANTLKIAGSAMGENLVTAEFFASDMVVGSLTGSLADRVPSVMEGWETQFAIDALGASPGTTVVPGILINWEINIANNLGRKYTARNSKAALKIPFGKFGVTAKFTFEASDAAAIAEFNHWNADEDRLVQLDFGENEIISGSDHKAVKLQIPGAWTVVGLSGNDAETRTYEFSMQGMYDPTLAASFKAIVVNGRTTAF